MTCATRIGQGISLPLQKQIQPCPSELIIAINQKTSYRVISNIILDAVLKSTLSDCAVRVWLAIYQQAWGDNRGGRVLSATYIATRLNKSKSTIDRAFKELRDAGFLVSTRQQEDEDGNMPRLLSARIPASVAEEGIKQKARKTATKTEEEHKEVQATPTLDTESPTTKTNSQIPRTKRRPTAGLQDCKKMSREEMIAMHEALKKNPHPSSNNDKGRGCKNEAQTNNKSIENNKSVNTVIDKFSKDTNTKILERVSNLGFTGIQAQELTKQIQYACSIGVFHDKKGWEGINICLKLIRTNKWRTPWGYIE